MLSLAACSSLDKILPVVEAPSIENQRASIAMSSLEELEEIDAYIKLDNSPLRDQISRGLETQASATSNFEFSRIRVRFARQFIALEGTLLISDGTEEARKASVHGDVILTFSGNQLIWLPHFDELTAQLLQQVNEEIADAVIVLGKNMVQIDPLPLGDIEVGAALTSFPNTSARESHKLGGVFTVAGSTILIESGITSIALDLEFIPSVSDCPSDVYVSRSTFAKEIRNRDESETESHFYTEISGATRPTSIVHYWFADGRPVALEELPVEPSYRWRTWSSKRIDRDKARNWEVIVVEKETGCILHSQAIHTNPAIDMMPDAPSTLREGYEQFRTLFESRVSSFSILDEKPDIALIEVPRPFLTEVLHSSLKDINIVVNFDMSAIPKQRLDGRLRPFLADDIFCEKRECSTERQCVAGFTQCVRQQDSRDCTRCLFRNPLNNRCLNEGTDPICEAAKTTQNDIFETNRERCMEQESIANQDCQRLVAQELRSCEIEATSERSACAAAHETVMEFAEVDSFADVALQLETGGGLSSIFSGIEIEGDLESIRLKLGFSGVLSLSGSVRFAPAQFLGPLASCINGWQKSFDGQVVLPYLGSSLIGKIQTNGNNLETDWSGYIVSAPISPTPLEAMFVDNPNLLADCQIGLTVQKVASAIEGPNSNYLSGQYPIEIQPLPSRINFAAASVKFDNEVFSAEAELSDTHLRYEVKN
jgi:hypothetical protein